MPAPDDAVAARRARPGGAAGAATGIDRGIDDELPFGRDLARLLEEPERKARRDAEADVAIAPALRGRAPVGRDLRRLGADLQEEAALVGGLPGAQVLDLDGVRGDARLVVEDLDLDEVRAPDLRAERQAPHDGEVAQRELAHDAADDDEREEHPEEEIEEVVRRC